MNDPSLVTPFGHWLLSRLPRRERTFDLEHGWFAWGFDKFDASLRLCVRPDYAVRNHSVALAGWRWSFRVGRLVWRWSRPPRSMRSWRVGMTYG